MLDSEVPVCVYCLKHKGRKDQQGSKTIWLPSAPKALGSGAQSPP